MFVAGYGKTVSHVIVGLKSAKETKQLKLDPPIYEWAISKLKNMSLSLKETFTRRRKLSKTSPCTISGRCQCPGRTRCSFHDGTADDEAQEN